MILEYNPEICLRKVIFYSFEEILKLAFTKNIKNKV